jgi:hypothetical protein
MGRRKQDSKSEERAPSPEKRPRQSRNPLRRGPSSKNMQQIPSPEASTTELPTSPARQDTPVEREPTQNQSTQPSLDQQRSEFYANGDMIEPIPPAGSSLTNGALVGQNSSADPKARPPYTIPEEVCPFPFVRHDD